MSSEKKKIKGVVVEVGSGSSSGSRRELIPNEMQGKDEWLHTLGYNFNLSGGIQVCIGSVGSRQIGR